MNIGMSATDSESLKPSLPLSLSPQFDDLPLMEASPWLIVSVHVPGSCGRENQFSEKNAVLLLAFELTEEVSPPPLVEVWLIVVPWLVPLVYTLSRLYWGQNFVW